MKPWLDDGDVRLYHGDALRVLEQLPSGSVDCIITSPPYYGLHAIGIELNADYLAIAARRLQQLSLLAEEPA